MSRVRAHVAGFCKPVITCACGDFLCGGATVQVTVGDEVVTWDDFRTANTRRR